MHPLDLELESLAWSASGPHPAAERDAEPLRLPTHATAGAEVRISGLAKTYAPREVLRGLELTIAPGEFVAVVGRSGCGKSTLLRLLAGLEPADAGTIAIDGRPLRDARSSTRIMFQEARLLPWKRVVDNVAIGLTKADARDRALDALAAVGLADRANDWPAVLSGGQRQRVALARALVHAPRLLLLDEPLGALDALTRIEMQRLIETVWRKHAFTALLVTHDVGEAVALADRVVLVHERRVEFQQTIDLLRPRSRGDAVYAALEEAVLRRVLGDAPALAA